MTRVTVSSLPAQQDDTVTGGPFPIGQCWGRWLPERQPAGFPWRVVHQPVQGCRPTRVVGQFRRGRRSCPAAGRRDAGASLRFPVAPRAGRPKRNRPGPGPPGGAHPPWEREKLADCYSSTPPLISTIRGGCAARIYICYVFMERLCRLALGDAPLVSRHHPQARRAPRLSRSRQLADRYNAEIAKAQSVGWASRSRSRAVPRRATRR